MTKLENIKANYPAAQVLITSSRLHTSVSSYIYVLLESDRSHGGSCIGVGHECSVKFSNTKDQAGPQHNHLYEREYLREAKKKLRVQGKRVL
jgi:hypothetical protein